MGRPKNLRWIVGVLALAALGTVLWFATRPPPLTVQGEVSSDRVDISPRVAGRIAKLGADVGDSVERGAVIAELESPQLVAALIAARAALSVAKADLDRINSTRPRRPTLRSIRRLTTGRPNLPRPAMRPRQPLMKLPGIWNRPFANANRPRLPCNWRPRAPVRKNGRLPQLKSSKRRRR